MARKQHPTKRRVKKSTVPPWLIGAAKLLYQNWTKVLMTVAAFVYQFVIAPWMEEQKQSRLDVVAVKEEVAKIKAQLDLLARSSLTDDRRSRRRAVVEGFYPGPQVPSDEAEGGQ